MTWVWLGAEALDYGLPDPSDDDGERTVWLYADPFRVLGARPSADENELRRAYRRVAREHHPDLNPGDEEALRRFHELQQAMAAANGEAEITVEPISGDWWSLNGFSTPEPSLHARLAVAGIRFELRDLHRVPLRDAEDTVRITYAGQTLPLKIAYSGSRSAAPLRRARLATAAEYSILVLLCLALVPVLALLLAVDLYVLSDRNDFVTLGRASSSRSASATERSPRSSPAPGKEVPTPRRAVRRTRAVVAELRALYAGRTRLE